MSATREGYTHAKNKQLAVCRALHSGVVVASQNTVTSPWGVWNGGKGQEKDLDLFFTSL